MAEKTKFELVSPERLLASEDVEMVVVPGSEGDFGVLKGHAPVISTLRTGTIAVYENGHVKDRIFVAGGFAEASAERVTVLADEAVRVADIDKAAIAKDLEMLRARLGAATEDAERVALAARIEIANAKLAAA
ncbi:MAG: ATP synthase F1 subunit epsilon [Alphaproteobacteria bacterium]|nr:ATP synthase F1 subunit epsilon [Alphaproteobacteria bacterium]